MEEEEKKTGLSSNMLRKRFLMVDRVIGEGIGQWRRDLPCRRYRHSVTKRRGHDTQNDNVARQSKHCLKREICRTW